MTFCIGNLFFETAACSAPLAGLSSLAWRIILHDMGCSLSFSEMVSSEGLIRSSQRSETYFENIPSARPFAVQLFGANPVSMSEAAKMLDQKSDIDIVDINMGCPVKKVVKRGAGSALMKEPKLAGEIVAAVRASTSKPLTVKMRAGWDEKNINCVEIARVVEGNGADAVIIHPRTRADLFKGVPRFELIGEVKSHLKIPVIGNGDIKTYADAVRMLGETGCSGVMIGRGAIGNPWIFKSIKEGREIIPDNGERLEVVLRHFGLMRKYRNDRYAVVHVRSILPWYVKGLKGSKELLNRVNRLTDPEEIVKSLSQHFE